MDPKYIDRDGFIKSHADWRDAGGDGIVLSVVAGLLNVIPAIYVDSALSRCIDPKTGCLMRRPDNTGGNQFHDGWMSAAVWCIYRGNAFMARGLLMSAVLRLGYMKHHPFNLEGKTWAEKFHIVMDPWLGRHPRVWIALIAASLPWAPIKICCAGILRVLCMFGRLDLNDSSGCQLKFIDRYAIMLLGIRSPMQSFLREFHAKGTSLADVLVEQKFWDADHPVIDGYRKLEAEVLNG